MELNENLGYLTRLLAVTSRKLCLAKRQVVEVKAQNGNWAVLQYNAAYFERAIKDISRKINLLTN